MTDVDFTHLIRQKSSTLVRYQSQLIAESRRRGTALSRVQRSFIEQQNTKLRHLDQLMEKVVEATSDAILTVNAQGLIETVNLAAARTFGEERHDMIGMPIKQILPHFSQLVDADDPEFAINRGHRETLGSDRIGRMFPVDIALDVTMLPTGVLYVVIIHDITEMRAQQALLEHQALHDGLTGLPNRVLLANRIEHALMAAPRSNSVVALLLLDLDRFKEVNDTLGHHIGDLLLRDLAQQLTIPVRAGDTVARLGGDEFAILLPTVRDANEALYLADRIMEVFRSPMQLQDGLQLDVGCSIGVALSPQHAEESSKLMQCADVAMYAAKAGPRKIILYDPAKDTNSLRQLTLSGELRQAIHGGLLSMEYQPQLDLRRQTIRSVEGLARWRHPSLGYVPPDEFITHAEQAGIIRDLTQWTLQEGLDQLGRWQAAGIDLSLAINISARLLQDNYVSDLLRELLQQYPIDTRKLTYEITESALVVDPEAARKTLFLLADLGVNLSIDDFGTGYSSLSYLQQLPLNELKIDKSFVFGLLDSFNDGVIVRSTIDLAHNLGLSVVAEGVESLEHIEMLASLDCDVVQGFCISPALTPTMLDQWMVATNWSIARKAA